MLDVAYHKHHLQPDRHLQRKVLGQFLSQGMHHFFIILQLLSCQQFQLIRGLRTKFVPVLLLQCVLVLLFVAFQQDGPANFLRKRLVDSQDGGLDEGQLLKLLRDGGVLEVDGPAALALLLLGDGGLFEDGFGFLMVLLDVGVQGRVGEVGLAAGAVEISAY